MRSYQPAAQLVSAALTLALFPFCAAGSGAAQPGVVGRPTASLHASGSLGRIIRPFVNEAAVAKATTLIAVSDELANVVDVYNPSGTQVAQFGGFAFPQGLTSDIKGDLYVADTNDGQIQIFAAGFQSPPTLLSDAGQSPIGVDSFSNGKFVAAANSNGSVTIFNKGVVIANITGPFIQLERCAFDATGNLYVTGLDSNRFDAIGEIPNATSGGTTLTELSITNSLRLPYSIQVTRKGLIAILDLSSKAVYTYNPPVNGSLGSPVASTALGGVPGINGFAFTNSMTHLYIVTTRGQPTGVYEYGYPAGGNPITSFGLNSDIYGDIAVIATEYPKH